MSDRKWFRAVVTIRDPRDGVVYKSYIGPYDTPGKVRGQVTSRTGGKGKRNYISCVIQEASWTDLSEEQGTQLPLTSPGSP